MNCPTCGNDNREGANFCRMCGAELAEMPAAETAGEIEAKAEQREEPQTEELTGQPESSDTEPAAAGQEMPSPEPVPESDGAEMPADSAESIGEQVGIAPQDPSRLAEDAETEEPESFATSESMEEVLAEEPEMEAEAPAAELESDEIALSALVSDAKEDQASPQEPAPESDITGIAADPLADAGSPEAGEEPEHEPSPETEPTTLPAEVDDTMPMPPLAPGSEIAGRYVIVEALDVQDSRVLYHAHDIQGCWQCGYGGNAADDEFCAQCGAQMDRRPQVLLLEVRDGQAEPVDGQAVAAELDHEERKIFLLAEAEPEARAQAEHQNLRLVVGQRSDPGQIRALDEDSLLVLTVAPTYESISGPVLGLYAVADGMGGHEGGEVASKIAIQVLAQDALQAIILPELSGQSAIEQTVLRRLGEATIAANDAVYLARQKRQNDMGTTLTTALIRDDRLFLAHVGDCRLYRWDASGLEQLTTDHSLVASMIASGQAEPEEIYTHPHRSVVYRCIGDKPVIEVDTSLLAISAGDRLILCCDGLWEMIRDEGIQDVMMQEADPQAACDLLVSHANLAGGEDNISVIVIQIEEF